MRVQRRLIFLLLLLAVLCSTGVSLKCYNCLDPVSSCTTNATCTNNMDSCLVAVSGKTNYQQCWKLSDCNSQFIMTRLGLARVKYKCCQSDMCNKQLNEDQHSGSKDEATSLSGKTALLGTSVLAAIWKLYF